MSEIVVMVPGRRERGRGSKKGERERGREGGREGEREGGREGGREGDLTAVALLASVC